MMLDFAEQTGSGIVIMVWSFLSAHQITKYLNATLIDFLHVLCWVNKNQDYYIFHSKIIYSQQQYKLGGLDIY